MYLSGEDQPHTLPSTCCHLTTSAGQGPLKTLGVTTSVGRCDPWGENFPQRRGNIYDIDIRDGETHSGEKSNECNLSLFEIKKERERENEGKDEPC